MRRPSLCAVTLTLLASLLLQSLPPATVIAQEGPTRPDVPAPIESPLPPPPVPITVPPLDDPHLPSLSLRLQTEPLWAAVGDVITATITVFNTAPDAAEELVLSLPLPADAHAATKDSAATATGWNWSLGTLKPGAQTVVTATLNLDRIPVGEALILQPEARARGLTVPIVATGGSLVTTTPAAKPGPAPDRDAPDAATDAPATAPFGATPLVTATAPSVSGDALNANAQPPVTPSPQPGPPSDSGTVRFTPGRAVELRSTDGRLTVSFPGDAFDRPLTLVHRTPTQQRPIARGRGQAEPPAVAGFHRGFGAFHLEATDDAGQPVTQFKRPVTLTLRFTPQQLQVLGIPAEALRLFWFDADRVVDRGKRGVITGEWVPQPTVIDAEAGTATLTIAHFSGYQLSDGSSPSGAYLPSLQGWQVSGFTGALNFSYPIEVPAGPAGIKPALALSYSSAATDGVGGMRPTAQASWVGKG